MLACVVKVRGEASDNCGFMILMMPLRRTLRPLRIQQSELRDFELRLYLYFWISSSVRICIGFNNISDCNDVAGRRSVPEQNTKQTPNHQDWVKTFFLHVLFILKSAWTSCTTFRGHVRPFVRLQGFFLFLLLSLHPSHPRHYRHHGHTPYTLLYLSYNLLHTRYTLLHPR